MHNKDANHIIEKIRKAKNMAELVFLSCETGVQAIEVSFKPAICDYSEEQIKHWPEDLKNFASVSRKEKLNIILDASFILKLLSNKNVESINLL